MKDIRRQRFGAKPKRRFRLLKVFLLLLFLVPAVPIIASYIECPFMLYYRSHLPKRTAFMDYRVHQAKARHKKNYRVRFQPVPLSSIPQPLRKAVVMAEDGHFYEHQGFDYDAIKEAYAYNQKRGKIVRGGSTISQQVAKNLWLSPERSWWRKIVEAVLTWRMEHALSKDRILEIYLNVIEWGDGIFGVGAAAQAYYGVTPDKLSVSQAAMLTAAIPMPLKFNPKAPNARIARRQARIMAALTGKKEFEEEPDELGAMLENALPSESEKEKEEEISSTPTQPIPSSTPIPAATPVSAPIPPPSDDFAPSSGPSI